MSLYWRCDWWDQRSTPAAQRFIRQKGNQSRQTQTLYHSGMRKNHVKIWCKVCLNQSSVQRGEWWFWLEEDKKKELISEGICQNPWALDILHLLSSLVRPWLASQSRKEITSVQWTSCIASALITRCSAVIRHLGSTINYVHLVAFGNNKIKIKIKLIYHM